MYPGEVNESIGLYSSVLSSVYIYIYISLYIYDIIWAIYIHTVFLIFLCISGPGSGGHFRTGSDAEGVEPEALSIVQTRVHSWHSLTKVESTPCEPPAKLRRLVGTLVSSSVVSLYLGFSDCCHERSQWFCLPGCFTALCTILATAFGSKGG